MASLASISGQDLYAARNLAPAVPNPASSPETRKLFKDCQKFEALLIANLWSEMQDGASLAGADSDPSAGTMQGFGIQAASTGLAKAGGVGIARMLYQELAPSLNRGNEPGASPGEIIRSSGSRASSRRPAVHASAADSD